MHKHTLLFLLAAVSAIAMHAAENTASKPINKIHAIAAYENVSDFFNNKRLLIPGVQDTHGLYVVPAAPEVAPKTIKGIMDHKLSANGILLEVISRHKVLDVSSENKASEPRHMDVDGNLCAVYHYIGNSKPLLFLNDKFVDVRDLARMMKQHDVQKNY